MDNYNFPVELQPIFLPNGKEIPNRKAVVRTDMMKSLGIVSDDYGLVNHATVVDSFREAGQQFGAKEKITLAKDGAFLFYEMTFPKVEMEVAKGDIVRMQMIAKNSYNGMNALQVVFGALRLVCLNGMVMGTQFLSFMYRHVGRVGGMTHESMIEQYQRTYTHYIELFSQRTPYITQMARTNIRNNDGLFEKENLELPNYLREEARVSYDNGSDKTVWGYYNALTYAVTHKLKKPNPDLSIAYGVEAWKAAGKLVEGEVVN